MFREKGECKTWERKRDENNNNVSRVICLRYATLHYEKCGVNSRSGMLLAVVITCQGESMRAE